MGEEFVNWSRCENNEMKESNSMSAWRLEDCPPYADTYIEWCFEKKCKEYRNGVYILTEWRERKKQYISYLQTAVFDFQHYSRHDDSHSVSILEAIEMLLGKERIDKLSIGDLWLLLESAYSHDLGMNLSYDDLVNLWQSQELKNYIESLINDEKYGHEAAAFYKVVDNLLTGKVRFDDLEHYLERHPDVAERFTNVDDSWPVSMERGIEEIVSEFVRKGHAARLKESISKMDKNSDPIVPLRLYKMMISVCVCHGAEEYEEILSLPNCEKGFGNSRIHPRFAAAMLRIGDLLDMDNNRFNIRAIEHYGVLPYMSSLHYKKHRDITHLAIRPDRIEAEAVCTELDVCVVTDSWFTMLSAEIKHLICYWNEMAPENLKGCLLTINPFKIYYEKDGIRRLFSTHPESEFRVDKAKMIELLMGANIYRSRIDFMREYLQNALDATKMRLWTELKSGRLQYSNQINIKDNLKDLQPFDIGSEIYNRFAIEVYVESNVENQKVKLTISDCGIGMEEECIKVISNIGGGWRTRSKYRKELLEMPKWLKPTGGFGIGIQSAFMVTDQVKIITKGIHEHTGRKIIMHNPKEEGRIMQEELFNVGTGTKVELELGLNRVFDVQRELNQFPYGNPQEHQKFAYQIPSKIFDGDNFFDAKAVQEYVFAFVSNYIETYFCNTLIPIIVISQYNGRTETKKINNQTFSVYNKIDLQENVQYLELGAKGKNYRFFYDPGNMNRSVIWCDEDASLAVISYDAQIQDWENNYLDPISLEEINKKNKKNKRGYVCFKNVKINRELAVKEPYMSFYNVFEDFMGFRAEQILKVHREELNPDFNWRIYADQFFGVYFTGLHTFFEKLIMDSDNQAVDAERELLLEKIYVELFQSVSQIIQLLYLKRPFADVKKGEECLTYPALSEEKQSKLHTLHIEYSANADDIELKGEFTASSQVLKILNELLTYRQGEKGKEPSLFIKVSDKKSVDKDTISLISSVCKKRFFLVEDSKTVTTSSDNHVNDFSESADENPKSDVAEEQLTPKPIDISDVVVDQEQWDIMKSLGKAGMIIADNAIVPLIENYDDFALSFFRLKQNGPIFARVTKKIADTVEMDKSQFYRISYNRASRKSPIFEADNINYYQKLRVNTLPLESSGISKKANAYLISPISKEVFDIIELEKVGFNRNEGKLSFSKFSEIILTHPSYLALEQWVFEMQAAENGEKISKKEIRKLYLQYIRKIYDENILSI